MDDPVAHVSVLDQAVQASERLKLFDALNHDLSDVELLSFAVQQAVAGLSGLGGMAHRSRPFDRTLRLAAASGLPREVAEPWAAIEWKDDACPARAVREGTLQWQPATECGLSGGLATVPGHGFPQGAGFVAVPLNGPDGTIGALTVLMMSASGPTPEQRDFLVALTDAVAGRLLNTRPMLFLRPGWWQVPTGSQEQEAVRPTGVGSWEWEISTGRLLADDVALHVGGMTREGYDDRIQTWLDLIHPDDAAAVVAEIERSIAEHSAYSVEYRIRRPDGNLVWIEARGFVTYDDQGEPQRMAGTLWESTETRMERDAVGRALRHMSDGFLAVDDEWRILYCNAEAERLFGATHRLLGRALSEAVPDIDAFGLAESQEATGDGPVGFDVQAPANQRWYHMRVLPVPGGLTIYFTDVTDERARRAEEARVARMEAERAAHVSDLTTALGRAVTTRDVLNAVADRVLPLFRASGLMLDAVEGDSLRSVGAVGYVPSFVDRMDGTPLDDFPPAAQALRDHSPKFIASAEEYVGLYPRLAEVRAEGGKQAWAFVPLIALGRAVGVCVLAFDEPRELTEDERSLLVTFSGLVAQAFERARLYDAEHRRSQELQYGMLPGALPELPAVTAAARYLPAGEGIEVGGDWYDVIPLSSERVALVIGDVMGHGLSEAVTMGRLRTAVRTLADLEIPPDELLARVNSLVIELGDTFYATCLYAIYDPTTRGLSFASAGHPPPVIAQPDGGVGIVDHDPDAPLGVATPPFATTDVVLTGESTIVLYTDGLVESAARDIDAGTAHLARTLAEKLPAPGTRTALSEVEQLARLCRTLTGSVPPQGERTGDDAAVLVARTHALAADDIADWTLPDDAIAAKEARDHVRDQLSAWHMDDLAMTTELLVSELVGNVIRHAKGPARLRLLRGKALVSEVYDGSLTTPQIRHASETDEGGRGLQLVATLAHRWGARYTPTGKCIWTEQTRTGPE